MPETLTVGEQVFNIEKWMVGGGNGELYRCRALNISNGERSSYALKVLSKNQANRIDRFQNETEVLSQLDHPSILKSIGNGTFTFDDADMPWMLMELGGYNLGIHVNGNARAGIAPKGPMPGEQFRHAALDMCDALEYVHQQGLIHRDIKPGNFVWTKRFEYDSVSLIDFGLCKRIGRRR